MFSLTKKSGLNGALAPEKNEFKLNFLVLGSGGREHAIAQKLLESKILDKLYLADANEGFSQLGENITYSDFEDLAKKSLELKIDILVVGPENPLCEGVVDVFKSFGIKCIGADKNWSRLESSKYFAKKFLEKHEIKTAKYDFIETYKYGETYPIPCVIKADGLCKGKGVKIVKTMPEAEKTVRKYLGGEFGEESKTLLVEEFLDGEELSLMSLWDGNNLVSLASARDFKRINADPDSANTGGMGAYCPVSLSEEQEKKLKTYEKTLENALKSEKADFTGFVYSGLIWNKKERDFYVLEYNMRLGDPETQALLTHLDCDSGSDFGEILFYTANRKLIEANIKWKPNTSACLVLAADTYPEKASCGAKITNILRQNTNVEVYYSGVSKKDNDLYTNGGRILSICTNGENPFEKLRKTAVEIQFEGKYFRSDIDLS